MRIPQKLYIAIKNYLTIGLKGKIIQYMDAAPPPTVQTSFKVPWEEWHKLKKLLADTHTTSQTFLLKALRDALERETNGKGAKSTTID